MDVGGTFTDVAAVDPEGTVVTAKVLTTPRDPSRGVLQGIDQLLTRNGLAMSAVGTIVHGTTLAANTLIERTGAVTGLITTDGFRDVIEIGNELRYDTFDLFLTRAEPLVPRALRRSVRERIGKDGEVLIPLSYDDLRAAADALRAGGVTSVAVAFMHAYRNPAHERAVGAFLRDHWPEVPVTLSSDVAPEIREYERFSTAVANAYVKPLIQRYLERLRQGLAARGHNGVLFVILSNGGIAEARAAGEFPIQLIESGPAAGVMGAVLQGRRAGEGDTIYLDMGGTTAKACLITKGAPARAYAVEAARVHRFKRGSGLPLRMPVIDMIEIGAGGGSIAQVDDLGLLKVGPRSAGAEPGPACYGLGGGDATVTDADLVLGYLDPARFLGGEMRLHTELATRALERVGRQLNLSAVDVAIGIHDVVNNNMATAARIHVAEKGDDPRRFALLVSGGAAPMHACGVARLLGIKRVVCPPAAGVASAIGMLVAPRSVEYTRRLIQPVDRLDWHQVGTVIAELAARGRAVLREAGLDDEQIALELMADMRYVGQGYEVAVQIPDRFIARPHAGEMRSLFDDAYERLFQQRLEGYAVEAISWRLRAATDPPSGDIRFPWLRGGQPAARRIGSRSIYAPGVRGFTEADVYDRYEIPAGAMLAGPVIVEERETTLVAGRGTSVRVDGYGNIIVDLP